MVYPRLWMNAVGLDPNPLFGHEIAVGVGLHVENAKPFEELTLVVLPTKTVDAIFFDVLI